MIGMFAIKKPNHRSVQCHTAHRADKERDIVQLLMDRASKECDPWIIVSHSENGSRITLVRDTKDVGSEAEVTVEKRCTVSMEKGIMTVETHWTLFHPSDLPQATLITRYYVDMADASIRLIKPRKGITYVTETIDPLPTASQSGLLGFLGYRRSAAPDPVLLSVATWLAMVEIREKYIPWEAY